MAYLILILAAALLFGGFIALTGHEARRGTRVFAGPRRGLDQKTEHLAFVLTHVDFGSFSRHVLRTFAEHVAHEVAHASLLAVRAAERLLSRTVRYLRSRRPAAFSSSAPPSSSFVQAITDFKQHLRAKRTQKETPKAPHPSPLS